MGLLCAGSRWRIPQIHGNSMGPQQVTIYCGTQEIRTAVSVSISPLCTLSRFALDHSVLHTGRCNTLQFPSGTPLHNCRTETRSSFDWIPCTSPAAYGYYEWTCTNGFRRALQATDMHDLTSSSICFKPAGHLPGWSTHGPQVIYPLPKCIASLNIRLPGKTTSEISGEVLSRRQPPAWIPQTPTS